MDIVSGCSTEIQKLTPTEEKEETLSRTGFKTTHSK